MLNGILIQRLIYLFIFDYVLLAQLVIGGLLDCGKFPSL